MYETLEHWEQYNKEKELQNKISKEFGLDKAIQKEKALKELGDFIDKLGKKNGYTNY